MGRIDEGAAVVCAGCWIAEIPNITVCEQAGVVERPYVADMCAGEAGCQGGGKCSVQQRKGHVDEFGPPCIGVLVAARSTLRGAAIG